MSCLLREGSENVAFKELDKKRWPKGYLFSFVGSHARFGKLAQSHLIPSFVSELRLEARIGLRLDSTIKRPVAARQVSSLSAATSSFTEKPSR